MISSASDQQSPPQHGQLECGWESNYDMELESRAAAVGVVGVMPLRGRGLRFVLVDELRQRGTMTVAGMVLVLAEYGFDVGGRVSKVVSDALRWEVARGRVVRVERGVYRFAGAPASTARRIRVFAARCRAWVGAVGRGEVPPLTPVNHRWWILRGQHQSRPPWEHLGWLWTA